MTGEVGGYLRFVNTGHTDCLISGWPAVTAIAGSGRRIRAARAIHGTMLGAWQDTVPLPAIRLGPGSAAYAVLAAGDHSVGATAPCPAVRHLLVFPPDNSRHVRLSARLYGGVYLPACTSVTGSTEIEVSAVVHLGALAH